jgi:hypothetical protein
MVNKTCAFCQEREGALKVELEPNEEVWICGQCFDGFITEALRQADAGASLPDQSSKTEPNLGTSETEDTEREPST